LEAHQIMERERVRWKEEETEIDWEREIDG
jgi:hypothetical protein